MCRRGEKSTPGSIFTTYPLQCSFGLPAESYVTSNFTKESFSKVGTKVEPLKQHNDCSALTTERIDTHDMRKQKKANTGDLHNDNTEFLRAEKNPAGGMRALTSCTTCGCAVYLRNYHKSGEWYLCKK